MKKLFFFPALIGAIVLGAASCQKNNDQVAQSSGLSNSEKQLITSAGFSSYGAQKRDNDSYLIEGDILLTKTQLQEMAKQPVPNNIVVGNEEHYRTTYVVNTPASGQRTIRISLSSTFNTMSMNYTMALTQSIKRYNDLNLKIKFERAAVGSGEDIAITARDLGGADAQGNVTLGQAGSFPVNGNPGSGFAFNSNPAATNILNTINKIDEVMAHELGHCVGFRHTDYVNRASCNQSGETAGTIGAVYIPGTPTTVTGTYNSWMMACTNNDPSFSSSDVTALNYVY